MDGPELLGVMGGDFKHFCLSFFEFSPRNLGEMIQIDEHIFQIENQQLGVFFLVSQDEKHQTVTPAFQGCQYKCYN